MENKYQQWINGFKKVVSKKLGNEMVDALFKDCEQCDQPSKDSEMAMCVRSLMESFDKNVAEDEKRFEVMETIGSYCVSPMLDKAKEIRERSQNVEESVKNLNQLFGGEFFRLEDNEIKAVLDRCVCHYGVSASTELISPTYCKCSLGYMKHLFKELLGSPVKVELLESVLTGGDQCQFVIKLDDMV